MTRFHVLGTPEPQGSARAFVEKGRAVVTSANPKMKRWRDRIATEAQAAGVEFIEQGPVVVRAEFRMPRPKSAPKRAVVPVTRPDVDKLGRACLDALTGICYRDDSQVVTLSLTKVYAEIGEPSGAWIDVAALEGGAG